MSCMHLSGHRRAHMGDRWAEVNTPTAEKTAFAPVACPHAVGATSTQETSSSLWLPALLCILQLPSGTLS